MKEDGLVGGASSSRDDVGARVRIVSFNVNGLRAALRRTGHRTLKSFLESLEAGADCV